MHLKNQKKAYLFALLTVLFWSSMSSAFKLTLNTIAFDSMLLWSGLFGFIVLLVINQYGHSPLKISLVTKGELRRSAIMGFFNPFLYYLILFKAYQLLEAQLAGTLNYLWPLILVMLSGLLLHQKIRLISYVALLISFTGVMIISTKGAINIFSIDQPVGVFLALGSAFIWAFYWILNMKDNREESGKIAMNLFFGIVYLLIYMAFAEGINFPDSVWGWIGCLYIGVFEMSFTFVIWLKALQFSENTAKVSNLVYLSPFLGLFFIWILVGEPIHFSTIVGLTVIIAGILLQQLSKTNA